MAANKHSTTALTRRGALSAVVNAVAAGTAAGTALAIVDSHNTAGAKGVDPIFALIDRHKAAETAFSDAVGVYSQLEEELPKHVRRSEPNELIITTDDPRWIAAVRDVEDRDTAANDLAIDLVSVLPTTIGGVMALLRYATEHEQSGREWPGSLVPDDVPDADNVIDGWSVTWGRDWQFYLCRSVAKALNGIAGSAVS